MKLMVLLFLIPILGIAAGWEGEYILEDVGGVMRVSSCEGTVCRMVVKTETGRCEFDHMLNMINPRATWMADDCEVIFSVRGENINVDAVGSCPFCESSSSLPGLYMRKSHGDKDSIMDRGQVSSIVSSWKGIKFGDNVGGGIEIGNCVGTVCQVEFDPASASGSGRCSLKGEMNFINPKNVSGTVKDCQLTLMRGFEGEIQVTQDGACSACEGDVSLANTYRRERPRQKPVESVELQTDTFLKKSWRKIKTFINDLKK